jgi:cysteine desulfuration protein SufE
MVDALARRPSISRMGAMETLESRLESVAEELSFVGDWTDRYRLLVEWGEQVEPLPEAECTSADEVVGCSSPLWLRARLVGDDLEVKGSSPGILPKALVAVVVRLFDGLKDPEGDVADIMNRLELKKHLSPTRALVLERMLKRALEAGRS